MSAHKLFIPALLLSCLGTLSSMAAAFQVCELNGQRINVSNGNELAGKSGLVRCKDSDSGLLMREEALRDGAFVGLRRQFDSNGKLARELQVNAKGNMQGLERNFAPNGQVLRETNYDNGREVGLARSFHPNGQLQRVAY